MSVPVILLVDDDMSVLESLRAFIESRINAKVCIAWDGYRALDILNSQKVDLMVLDISMPGISGIEVAERARAMSGDMAVLVMTGWDCDTLSDSLGRIGVEYVPKPVTLDVIYGRIESRLTEDGKLAGMKRIGALN